jgi:endoglucanase Acf2
MKSSSSSSSGAQLLMLALPHHMDIMSNPDTVIFDGVFQCIKGDMTPIVGKKWIMQVCAYCCVTNYWIYHVLQKFNIARVVTVFRC